VLAEVPVRAACDVQRERLQRHEPAKLYLERRMAGGETKTEAIRALRWRISDAVYACLVADERLQRAAVTEAA
jgi:hypothetical protein